MLTLFKKKKEEKVTKGSKKATIATPPSCSSFPDYYQFMIKTHPDLERLDTKKLYNLYHEITLTILERPYEIKNESELAKNTRLTHEFTKSLTLFFDETLCLLVIANPTANGLPDGFHELYDNQEYFDSEKDAYQRRCAFLFSTGTLLMQYLTGVPLKATSLKIKKENNSFLDSKSASSYVTLSVDTEEKKFMGLFYECLKNYFKPDLKLQSIVDKTNIFDEKKQVDLIEFD